MNQAELRIAFADEAAARTARDALEPDNEGHLETELDGATLVLRADAGSVMGLLRTLDDALACLRAIGE